MHYVFALVSALVSTLLPLGAFAQAVDEPRSSVSILVDLSETWHNDQSRGHNKTVLEIVADATIEFGKQARPPVHVRALPIGDVSLLRPPMCEALFDPKLICGTKPGDKTFCQEKALRNYLKTDCTRFVLTRPKEKWTDISGAIASAGRLSAQQAGGERAIIVLSDMFEERPKGQPPAEFSLQGFRVLLVYRTLDDDRRQPERLDRRLNEWTAKLSAAGARVHKIPDQGLTVGQIVRLLRD